jgi:hypothetical protein
MAKNKSDTDIDILNLEIHPLAETFPPLDGEELKTLAADIKEHGLLELITLYEGKILDGRNRYKAARLAPHNLRQQDFVELPPDKDPLIYVISKNAIRRHLTQEQKQELIKKLLEQRPDASSRLIASIARVSHHTVENVRRRLAGEPEPAPTDPATGQVAQLNGGTTDPPPAPAAVPATTTRTGADGKTRTIAASSGKTKSSKPLKTIKETLPLLTDAASQREVFLLVFDMVLTKYRLQKVNRWLRTHKECVIRFLDDDDEVIAPPADYADEDEQPGQPAPSH